MRSSKEEYDSAISGSIEPPISSNARFSFASGVSGVVTINQFTSFCKGVDYGFDEIIYMSKW